MLNKASMEKVSGATLWQRVAAAVTFGVLWLVLLVLAMEEMVDMEVQQTDQLVAMLAEVKEESLSTTACGDRPQLDRRFPFRTRRMFMEYNDCLAHCLARPSLLSAAVYIIPIVVAILLVHIYRTQHTQSQPSSHAHVIQARVC